MLKGKRVILCKISSSESPAVPTPNPQDYVPGQLHLNYSVPISYEVQGTLAKDIVVGRPVEVSRTHRNGVAAIGFMRTSPVNEINVFNTHVQLKTDNSIYNLYQTQETELVN